MWRAVNYPGVSDLGVSPWRFGRLRRAAPVLMLLLCASLTGCAREGGREQQLGLYDYGPAPELVGIAQWLNSKPLTLAQLRGNVVLVEFWTHGCGNCRNVLPHVNRWYRTYRDQGFIVIGIHTPEYLFEHDPARLQQQVRELGITYPVAQDNSSATWNAYENQFWPAAYLLDRRGRIMLKQFGEGDYDRTETAIRDLLAIDAGRGS